MEEGAFVDRDRAAAIWRGAIVHAAPHAPKPKEEIVWVPGPWRDPALLEWQRGGRFELKIFPIPKRGSRRVVLTYTQTVDQTAGVRRFTYPLAHDQSHTRPSEGLVCARNFESGLNATKPNKTHRIGRDSGNSLSSSGSQETANMISPRLASKTM